MIDWNPYEDLSFDNDINYDLLGTKCLGLDMNDIYNVLSFDLYENIVKIKWLLYDVRTENNTYPMVVILRIFFNLSFNVNEIEWENIDNKYFTYMWNAFVKEAESGGNILYKIYNLSNNSLKNLLKGLLFSFENSWTFSRKNAEKTGYIPISDIDENNTDKFITILPNLKSMTPRLVYEFITESLQLFKNTWYGTKLMTKDKKDIITNDFYFYKKDNDFITYKNIYNYAKNFVRYKTKSDKNYEDYENNYNYENEFRNNKYKYKRYPENWKSLDKNQKKNILQRLNKKYTNWFNIKEILKNQQIKNFVILNDQIFDNIMLNLTSIIFESLIMKGILTKFVPNKKITNEKILSREDIYKSQEKIFETNNNNKYWTSSYHFLTELPYMYINSFELQDGQKGNYFTICKSKNPWYTMSAYDWIAQIGFCHHFLNNRVIFITGATGVGKSTEIPKLFLYFSKALEYIKNPHVICTQPRIEPTRSNAMRVSTSLGVPIYENTNNKETSNYYIQTRYSESGSHYKSVVHSMLQYCTDGTLILEANNPVMKEKYIKDKTNKNIYSFKNENIYDVIMIDEAHEHKITMDLLLTFLRYASAYNNKIKLVIVSATMDNDEANYRRFFRDINDNKKYPLNTWIQECKLDRINIDRRYHISPPGKGTRFKINEEYIPGISEIDCVLNIIKTSDKGDILIFEPGASDINDLVKKLNMILPTNIITFPFFGKMDEKKKEFVGKIESNLQKYKLDRNISFTDSTTSIENIGKGNNTYTRAIIVATNIAEASITINSLRYVINTGTQKVEIYNYKKRNSIQRQIFIAKENEKQRKGRVGRVASGDVYHLYDKNKLDNNKIAYEISTKNIMFDMFSKFKNDDNDDIIILEQFNPNNPKTNINYDNLKKIFGKYGLSVMIEKQYFLDNKYFSYYGNDDFYDYKNFSIYDSFYNSGFKYSTLSDNYGKFYLIHPNELDIVRNIGGDIIGKINNNSDDLEFFKDKKYSGYISSKKILSFWQIMLDLLYVTFNNKKDDLIKTIIGKEFIEIFEELKLEEQYHGFMRAVIFGMCMNRGDDIVKLTSFYRVINMSPINLLLDKTKLYEKTEDSDSKIILNYLKQFDEYLSTLNIETNTFTILTHIYSTIPEVKRNNLTKNDLQLLFKSEDDYSIELNKSLSSSDDKKKNILKSIDSFVLKNLFNNLKNNSTSIISWCQSRNLNYDNLMNYIIKYNELKNNILRIMTNKRKIFIEKLKNIFNTIIKKNTSFNPIDIALFFGFPLNLCKKSDESKYYLSLYNPNIYNIYKIKSLSNYKYKPNTLVDVKYLEDYLLYFTLDITDDELDNEPGDEPNKKQQNDDIIICLHKIEPKMITLLSHIYNNKIFLKIINNNNDLQKEIETLVDKNENSNLTHLIINYTKTLRQIKIDLEQNPNDDVAKLIKKN
jgi:hypothetical protein